MPSTMQNSLSRIPIRWIVLAGAVVLIVGLAFVSGCSKNSSAAKTSVGVVEASLPVANPKQTASERLRAATWVYAGKDGSTQRLRFGADGRVAVSETHPTFGNKASSFLYRIVSEDGERLTLHIADDTGASVTGIQAVVGERLEFPTGGAFGINGVYEAR
jgi:hypothetical protein